MRGAKRRREYREARAKALWPPTPEETVALELLKGEMHEIEAEIRSHVSTVVVF